MNDFKRTLHTAPDSLGRVHYTDEWYDPTKPYCGVCGRIHCEHEGTKAYGRCAQVFFCVPRD